jgi:hypothetical protein
MIDFALIPNNLGYNDLAMDDNGNLLFVQDANCINQMIVTALKLFIGEYEYNNQLGIAWVTGMQTGYEDIPILQYQVQQTINSLNNYINDDNLKITDVQQTNFSFDVKRNLILTVQVQLANGQVLGINTNG